MDSDSSTEDVPLAARMATSSVGSVEPSTNGDVSGQIMDESDSSDEDTPLATSYATRLKSERRVVSDSESEEDVPLAKRVRPAEGSDEDYQESPKKVKVEPKSANGTPTKSAKPSKRTKSPLVKREKSTPSKSPIGIKKEASSSPSKGPQTDDDNDDNEDEKDYKWWLSENQGDNSVKWQTLEHKGPLFPPPYVPHGVRMKYDGVEVDLDPEAEEVASFFADLLQTDWAANPVFQSNFFRDFTSYTSKSSKSAVIKEFSKCDFTPIAEYLARKKEEKKNMTKEEKQALKTERMKIDEEYGWALLNGRKEKVGNYRIEPPGLFRGRGEHPKTGTLKLRVEPEQVTINIGEDAPVPAAPPGHKWGGIIHDNTVTWLAMWKENVNDGIKYVFLAANSSLKGQSDFKKFEKARELRKHVVKIRRDYTTDLRSKEMAVRQRATAMYLIDRLALRAGNEKGDDEADTVGCCSLRFEHITLEPPNTVVFDFLGKDSIRYYNEVKVDEQVFKNLKIFKRPPKTEGDPLFDRLNTSVLNKHLSTYMKGLTAKVFRTYNASYTFQEELRKTPGDASVAEKILAYNRANRQVAILCNHQRSVPKAHGNQMQKLKDKILATKYERKLVKEQMLELDPKLRKSRKELTEPESELDDEFIERHKVEIAEKEEEKRKVKLQKENEKRQEEGLAPLKELPPPRTTAPTLERLEKKYVTLTERIKAQKTLVIDKDENKTTSLSTSKINYIDPRISVAWCYKHEVPLEKIFTKTLREKFKWAMDLEASWEF